MPCGHLTVDPSLIVTTAAPFLLCNPPTCSIALGVFLAHPFVIAIILVSLLLIGWWKQNWFNKEPLRRDNPYITIHIYEVLMFARIHKHPPRRSAFTYCDDYIPTRLDFAKQRYGGPFDTKQVESVKTFGRILFSIGPLFNLEVPSSYFVFPLFGLHALHYHTHWERVLCRRQFLASNCWKWKLHESAVGADSLSNLYLAHLFLTS